MGISVPKSLPNNDLGTRVNVTWTSVPPAVDLS